MTDELAVLAALIAESDDIQELYAAVCPCDECMARPAKPPVDLSVTLVEHECGEFDRNCTTLGHVYPGRDVDEPPFILPGTPCYCGARTWPLPHAEKGTTDAPE